MSIVDTKKVFIHNLQVCVARGFVVINVVQLRAKTNHHTCARNCEPNLSNLTYKKLSVHVIYFFVLTHFVCKQKEYFTTEQNTGALYHTLMNW